MATHAKPAQKDSPFNALLERKSQPANRLNVETSKGLDSQTTTGLAKSTDPEYIKFTTYVRKKTHRAVKLKVTEQERELSDLVEELLSSWLEKST
jgi:hypothetical protein